MSSQLAEELPLSPSASHLLLLNGELAILVQHFIFPFQLLVFTLPEASKNHKEVLTCFKQSSPFFKKQA